MAYVYMCVRVCERESVILCTNKLQFPCWKRIISCAQADLKEIWGGKHVRQCEAYGLYSWSLTNKTAFNHWPTSSVLILFAICRIKIDSWRINFRLCLWQVNYTKSWIGFYSIKFYVRSSCKTIPSSSAPSSTGRRISSLNISIRGVESTAA